MFDINSKLKLVAVVASLTIAGFTSNVAQAADISSADGQERIVISLKTDPTKDSEAACVALQIGMNFLMSPGGLAPADDVTLFVMNGGVELINPNNSIHNSTNPKPVCTTPNGVKTASLQTLLTRFQGLGGNVAICTLCIMHRGITEPVTGEISNGISVHNLFLGADKVVAF